MFLKYEQITVSSTVLTQTAFAIPKQATMVELQADTQNVRYTMDTLTDPSQTSGMVLLTTEPPRTFLIEDLKRIRMVRGAGSDAKLNVHYFGGRNV